MNKMILRSYQQEAVDSIIKYTQEAHNQRCCVVMPTGSGKSLVVAHTAFKRFNSTNSKVICLQPSKELVAQNAAKFEGMGISTSIYCSGLGSKDASGDVILGTWQTIKGNIDKILEANKIGTLIIDECHNVSNSILKVIAKCLEANDSMKIVGLTATPYKSGSGLIYNDHYKDGLVSYMNDNNEELFRKPLSSKGFMHYCCYEIKERELIEQGYLTDLAYYRPKIKEDGRRLEFDVDKLERNKSGSYTSESIERVFNLDDGLVELIVDDMLRKVNEAGSRKVLIFCASISSAINVKHFLELDTGDDIGFVDGNTLSECRTDVLEAFIDPDNPLRFLINVGVLTTGFDAPHCDCIVFLRATQSPTLYKQIIGRGMRIAEGKTICKLLDYGKNVVTHASREDIYTVKVGGKESGGVVSSEKIEVICKDCEQVNKVTLPEDVCKLIRSDDCIMTYDSINEYGQVWMESLQDLIKSLGIAPSHSANQTAVFKQRQCNRTVTIEGRKERCNGLFHYRECHNCGEVNNLDTAYCEGCGKAMNWKFKICPRCEMKVDKKLIGECSTEGCSHEFIIQCKYCGNGCTEEGHCDSCLDKINQAKDSMKYNAEPLVDGMTYFVVEAKLNERTKNSIIIKALATDFTHGLTCYQSIGLGSSMWVKEFLVALLIRLCNASEKATKVLKEIQEELSEGEDSMFNKHIGSYYSIPDRVLMEGYYDGVIGIKQGNPKGNGYWPKIVL